MDKIIVISMVNGEVSINLPDIRFKRSWKNKGAKQPVDAELLKEALYDNGVRSMFDDGILYVEDLKEKQFLGLEPEDVTEPVNIIVPTDKEIERWLKLVPFGEFKQNLEKLSRDQKLRVADYAVEHECIDMDKCEYLRQAANVDVIGAIKLKRQNEEA